MQLEELQRAVADLQRAALDSEQQLAGSRAAATAAEAEVRLARQCLPVFARPAAHETDPGDNYSVSLPICARALQAVLAAAYGRRLQRLAALLQRYDAQLQRALAALGLMQQQQQSGDQNSKQEQQLEQPTADALAALAAGLQQLEQQLAAAVLGAAEPPTTDALLELGSKTDLAAAAAAAGPCAILQALQGALVTLWLGCEVVSISARMEARRNSHKYSILQLTDWHARLSCDPDAQLQSSKTLRPSTAGPRWPHLPSQPRQMHRWAQHSRSCSWSRRRAGQQQMPGGSACSGCVLRWPRRGRSWLLLQPVRRAAARRLHAPAWRHSRRASEPSWYSWTGRLGKQRSRRTQQQHECSRWEGGARMWQC